LKFISAVTAVKSELMSDIQVFNRYSEHSLLRAGDEAPCKWSAHPSHTVGTLHVDLKISKIVQCYDLAPEAERI
jgi:hypothetical protein